nr:SRPBCC family protein [Janibacter melonis]
MPQVSADVHVPVPPELAFAVSQTHGAIRRGWDPFIREQHFLDGAQHPATGVRTFTRSAFLGPISPTMVSEYVSWRPPTSVGMTMVSGPPFFSRFGGVALHARRRRHPCRVEVHLRRRRPAVVPPHRRDDRAVAARARDPQADRRLRRRVPRRAGRLRRASRPRGPRGARGAGEREGEPRA